MFRRHVGRALLARDGDLHGLVTSWGVKQPHGRRPSDAEQELERRVSDYIRVLPFAWVEVPDAPGPDSLRAVIERGAIALLSNSTSSAVLDPRSGRWLGCDSPEPKIRSSGLWNVMHVDELYSRRVLDILEGLIAGAPEPGLRPSDAQAALSVDGERGAAPSVVELSGLGMSEELYRALNESIRVGSTIPTLANGKPNRIADLRRDGVWVETDKSRAEGSPPRRVPDWMLQRAWDHLRSNGSLTQAFAVSADGLNIKRSAAVLAILAKLPGVTVASSKPSGLIYGR